MAKAQSAAVKAAVIPLAATTFKINNCMERDDIQRIGLTYDKGGLFYAYPEDTRKPKLTLKHLNKMKKFKAMHNMEMLKREEILTAMYGDGEGDDGGDGGGDLF